MKSLFAQLFLAIQTRIINMVPEIKWIDQDVGQLEHYEVRPSVQFPCILIDFMNTQYNQEGNNTQMVNLQIELRLGFSPFQSANSVSPDISKQQALQFYEVEQKVYEALNNWVPADAEGNSLTEPLIRFQAATERRNDPYRIRTMQFVTATEDDTAVPKTTKQRIKLAITGGLNFD